MIFWLYSPISGQSNKGVGGRREGEGGEGGGEPPRPREGRYDVTGDLQMAIITPPGQGAIILAMGAIPGW